MFRKKGVYAGLLLFRLACALSPSYIHPDEFFQSGEVTAAAVFGVKTRVPWEYDSAFPCRSILPPALTTGFPFLLLRLAARLVDTEVTTAHLFAAQRLSFFGVSVGIDYGVYRLLSAHRADPKPALLLLSTSYVHLLFDTRPFSNAAESLLVVLTALLATRSAPSPPSSKAGVRISTLGWRLVFGAVVAFGVFTRVTYIGFAAPLGMLFLWLVDAGLPPFATRSLGARIMCAGKAALPVALGFVAGTTACILADCVYFGAENAGFRLPAVFDGKSWMRVAQNIPLVPLNNLLYNLDRENLALHGLHPRYTHVLLNFPVLYSSLAIMSAYHVLCVASEWICAAKARRGDRSPRSRRPPSTHGRFEVLKPRDLPSF